MSKTILIADDDLQCREIFSAYLKSKGYDVLEAANGKKALELIENKEISLLLLDIIMPDVDGLEVLRSVKESHPDLPVIALTGLKDAEKAKLVMKAGANDYVTKPVDFQYLDEAISALLL